MYIDTAEMDVRFNVVAEKMSLETLDFFQHDTQTFFFLIFT